MKNINEIPSFTLPTVSTETSGQAFVSDGYFSFMKNDNCLEIIGAKDYFIYKDGKVLTCKKRSKILKTFIDNCGYEAVCLNINKKVKVFKVHRLVAIAFIDNPNNLPTVNHINGIKTDNRIENLEWMSYSDNIKHAYKNNLIKTKRGGLHYKAKKVLNTNTGKVYDSIVEAADSINITGKSLSRMLNNTRKNTTNFVIYGNL